MHAKPQLTTQLPSQKKSHWRLLSVLLTLTLLATWSFTPAFAQTINVCSHKGTYRYNILGGNAEALRAKLDNPDNFGPGGAFGTYQFKYTDVGDNFTERKILGHKCNIWFSGYEPDGGYTSNELNELRNWVHNHDGQVIAGCDSSAYDPVCGLLGFSVKNDSDSYGFLSNTAGNPLNCNAALTEGSHLNMSGGAGAYFSGREIDPGHVLAVHETNQTADSGKPIVIYTGNYFLTSDINMIQTGSGDDVALSHGNGVVNNNDILAMNAFSALADASLGKEVCSSVKKTGKLRVFSSPAGAPVAQGPGSTKKTVALPGDTTVELVFDGSLSMTKALQDSEGNPSTREAVAKDVLKEVVNTVLPDAIPIALRAFGTKGGCDTTLLMGPATLDKGSLSATIANINVAGQNTNIAGSIKAVRGDLAKVTGPKLVVLVTDGEENCASADAPLGAIEALRKDGFDVSANYRQCIPVR